MTAPDYLKWFNATTPGQQDPTIAATDTPMVPYERKRVALVITCPNAGTVWLTWGRTAVVNQGIGLTAGSSPLVLSLAVHGALVQGPIRAIMSAGSVVVSYVETLAPIS